MTDHTTENGQFQIEHRDAGLFRWRVAGEGRNRLGMVWTDTFLTRRGAERFIRRHTWTRVTSPGVASDE